MTTTTSASLLNLAYAPLAERGMHYVASHQGDNTTRYRCGLGTCFVAELDGRVIGTVTRNRIDETSGNPWYDRDDCAAWHQFAVHPDHQGSGIGRLLMDAVEAEAREARVCELGVDTSEHAHELIALYERRGYLHVGTTDWPATNYLSVVMSKTL